MSSVAEGQEYALVAISEARSLWSVDADPLFPPAGGKPSRQDTFERVFISNVATWRAVVDIDRRLYLFMRGLVEDAATNGVNLAFSESESLYIFKDGNAVLLSNGEVAEHFWNTPDNPSIEVVYDDDMVDEVLSLSGRVGQLSFLVPDAVERICDDVLAENFEGIIDGDDGDIPGRIRELTARYILTYRDMRNEFHDLQVTQESWLKGLMDSSRPGTHQQSVMGIPVNIILR